MIEFDVRHSEIFPYAIRLVKDFGATEIYIEPHINGHTPDIVGKTAEGSCIIVECDYHQPTCRAKIESLAKDKELREKSRIYFILRGDVDKPSIKELIRKNFGDNAFYIFDEMEAHGKLNLTDLLK